MFLVPRQINTFNETGSKMRFGEQSKEIRPVVNFNGSRLLSSVVIGIEQFITQEVGGGGDSGGWIILLVSR